MIISAHLTVAGAEVTEEVMCKLELREWAEGQQSVVQVGVRSGDRLEGGQASCLQGLERQNEESVCYFDV